MTLKCYYVKGGTRNIRIHLVGYGPETRKYTRLVNKLSLNDRVIFHGIKTGAELEKIYLSCDIGISGLASYKQHVDKSSSLKVREYLTHGLPIISGCREDVFDTCRDNEYYLEFPNDDSDIDMQIILDYYDKLIEKYGQEKKCLSRAIQSFALDHVDIVKTMQPICDCLDYLIRKQI